MNTILVESQPPGAFEEISIEMPEWDRKFIEMINIRKPITYDVYTMPNLSNQIQTELERNCYCRYNLKGTDRFFLISNPIRSQTQQKP
jgi:hypothetical protein